MTNFFHTIKQTFCEIQLLATQNLDLLRPEIQLLLNSNNPDDMGKIENILDCLYDSVMWGEGREEYEMLVKKLETMDMEVATYYRQRLDAKD